MLAIRRVWRWALLGVALLALLSELLIARRAPPTPIAATVHSPPPVARTRPAAQGTPANVVRQHPQVHTPDAPAVDDLCGVQGAGVKRGANETFAQHVMRQTQTAISGWKSALASSEDPRRQAVGWALENANPTTLGGQPPVDTPGNNSLVLLALQTNDPAIYALALGHCGPAMAVGPCQALSWEHWANIDPDNAVPWLHLAAKAYSSGDQQGAEEALAKASTAPRFDPYVGTLVSIALSALPRDIAPLEKAVAGGEVTILGMGSPLFEISLTLCSEAAVQDPTRRQQCTSIANAAADVGTSMMDSVVASMLARRLGFPPERLAKLQKERQNARRVEENNPWTFTSDGSGSSTLRSDFGCDTVLGYDAFLDALRDAGGNERAALVAVGRTVPGAK